METLSSIDYSLDYSLDYSSGRSNVFLLVVDYVFRCDLLRNNNYQAHQNLWMHQVTDLHLESYCSLSFLFVVNVTLTSFHVFFFIISYRSVIRLISL